MTFDDFLDRFDDMSICRVFNTSMFTFAKTWHESQKFGSWTCNPTGALANRAGGCGNHESFMQNPQFRFDVGGGGNDNQGEEVIIQLSQQDWRDKVIQ